MMNTQIRNGDSTKVTPQNSYEFDLFKKVVKDSWRSNLVEGKSDPKNLQTIQLLDEHSAKMEMLLKNLDYEAICMQNIISNSKHMSIPELKNYLTLIEKLAVGYQHIFTSDITDIILIGLTSKARDLKSIKKYHESLLSGIESNLNSYNGKSSKEEKMLNQIAMELHKRNKGVFKFLRKGEIKLLEKIITSKKRRIVKYTKRISTYSSLISKLK